MYTFDAVAQKRPVHLYTKNFDTKDFVLLYYSIIKDHIYHKQNLRPDGSLYYKSKNSSQKASGGGERDRTDGLLRARQALSQLSYTPMKQYSSWWA